jgi:hypothetical protein
MLRKYSILMTALISTLLLVSAPNAEACGACGAALFDRFMPPVYFWMHIPDDREHQFRLIANSVPFDREQCSGASRTKKIQTI